MNWNVGLRLRCTWGVHYPKLPKSDRGPFCLSAAFKGSVQADPSSTTTPTFFERPTPYERNLLSLDVFSHGQHSRTHSVYLLILAFDKDNIKSTRPGFPKIAPKKSFSEKFTLFEFHIRNQRHGKAWIT